MCSCRSLACLRGLPRNSGGSASASSLSRPAQASLTLRPTGLLNRPWRPLSRGFDPASYPAKSLVSYQTYRQLSGWIDPSSTGETRHRGALNNPGLRASQHWRSRRFRHWHPAPPPATSRCVRRDGTRDACEVATYHRERMISFFRFYACCFGFDNWSSRTWSKKAIEKPKYSGQARKRGKSGGSDFRSTLGEILTRQELAFICRLIFPFANRPV
jgi:hypothetical protein